MSKAFRVIGLCIVSLGLVGAATPVAAQTAPSLWLGAAYQGSRIPENTNPLGFNLDVGVPLMAPWGVFGEIGLTRDSETEDGLDASLTDWNFVGGVRYAGAMAPLSGSIDLGAGLLRRSFDFEGEGDSDTAFLIQPGFTLTYDLMENAGLAFGIAYRRVFWDDESGFSANDEGGGENQFRWTIGVRIGLPRP